MVRRGSFFPFPTCAVENTRGGQKRLNNRREAGRISAEGRARLSGATRLRSDPAGAGIEEQKDQPRSHTAQRNTEDSFQ